jgi:hypothetical protein
MNSHYDELRKLSEVDLLSRCIWGEARGEKIDGKLAVAYVILNRVRAQSYYGGSIKAVILKPRHFSCFNANDQNLSKILNLTPSSPELSFCRAVAELALQEGLTNDPTNGATHYHTVNVNPSWAPKLTFLCRIGSHLFYREDLSRSRGTSDAQSVIAQGGTVLPQADDALLDLLDSMDDGSPQSTSSADVAHVAEANQSITNTVSAASQCVSTGKQNDQKITQAMMRNAGEEASTEEP